MMKIMRAYITILLALVIFFFMCIYFRTGYFESSISTNKMTFYLKGGDTISSEKYYRDLSGNWILLDKKVVITNGDMKLMTFKTNLK